MLIDSLNEFPGNPDKAYENYCKRIDSIKTEATREKAFAVKNKYICRNQHLSCEKLEYLPLVKEFKELYQKLYLERKDQEFEEEMKGLWSDYLMAIFVQEKYNQKQKESRRE